MLFDEKALKDNYKTKSLVFCAALRGNVSLALFLTDFIMSTDWIEEGSSEEEIVEIVQGVLEDIKGLSTLEDCKAKLLKVKNDVDNFNPVGVIGAE